MLGLGATWTTGEAEIPIEVEDYDKKNLDIKQQPQKFLIGKGNLNGLSELYMKTTKM